MKKLFGESWMSSLAGYILAGLTVAQEMIEKGDISPIKLAIAIFIAVLGRVVADGNKVQSTPVE